MVLGSLAEVLLGAFLTFLRRPALWRLELRRQMALEIGALLRGLGGELTAVLRGIARVDLRRVFLRRVAGGFGLAEIDARFFQEDVLRASFEVLGGEPVSGRDFVGFESLRALCLGFLLFPRPSEKLFLLLNRQILFLEL